ncbi:unnamed protein product [Taenia asiatica]|uniref:ShKT domain-containing protein n=1 Tax=Taenia asiatica TaxID=60517 RepID=A0A0R3W4K3_TAEAS|nr:unnamed protein product [Taenia asiatica]
MINKPPTPYPPPLRPRDKSFYHRHNLLSLSWKTPNGLFMDRQENCVYWARVGHCAKTSGYMKMMCPESCGYCNLTKSDSSVSDECKDQYLYPSDCEAWAKEGKCTSNKLWMHFNCAKSCGLCTNPRRYTATTRGFTTKAPNTCKNNYGTQNCRLFASRRMCLTHKSWMERQCRAICGFCQTETTTVVPSMRELLP